MRELGCYTDKEKQEVHIAETWACPASAGLSNEDKFNRKIKSREELLKVNWTSSWEPEEARQSGPASTIL
eukprot:scaffold90652_cov17-Tisochrysis_lutea.AAC.1